MTRRNSIHPASAFAITVGIGYALCSLVFWLFPEAAANFMNALFHGLDFRPLASAGAFTFGSFAYGLAVLVAWAFLLGAIFGLVSERLRPTP